MDHREDEGVEVLLARSQVELMPDHIDGRTFGRVVVKLARLDPGPHTAKAFPAQVQDCALLVNAVAHPRPACGDGLGHVQGDERLE